MKYSLLFPEKIVENRKYFVRAFQGEKESLRKVLVDFQREIIEAQNININSND